MISCWYANRNTNVTGVTTGRGLLANFGSLDSIYHFLASETSIGNSRIVCFINFSLNPILGIFVTVTSFNHHVDLTCMQTNYCNRFCQNLYTCCLQRHSCVFCPTELQRLHAVIQNSTTFTISLNFHTPMRQRTA